MSLSERVGRRVCFIHNPAAGRGTQRQVGPRLEREAGALGWDAAVRTTEFPGHEVALAEDAARTGCRFVVAVGGDGTIHGVANGVLRVSDETIVGVVPVGTGNDFAFMTGLRPGDVGRNLARLFAAGVMRFDVGRALDEYFINGLGVGFDAEVVRQLESLELKGFARYVAAVYKTFWGFRPPQLAVEADEHAESGALMMLEIAIGRRVGGGFRLTPDALPDDGFFDVCVIRRVSALQFLRWVPRVIRGTHGGLSAVTIFRTRAVAVGAAPPVHVHMDGELRLPDVTRFRAELVPSKLWVACAS